jgi:DNA-binding NarL/FixJ family response regulator
VNKQVRVLIVDDHALVRDGMASLLVAWGFQVVGQAKDGIEGVERARVLRPDLILMDINMPGMNGRDATRLIKAEMPDIKVVVVTVSDDDENLFEAIKCGAQGYILKGTPGDEVGDLLMGIAEGRPALSPGLAAKILEEFAGARDSRPRKAQGPDPLTEREIEILVAVSSGKTNKEIADHFTISTNTVNFHMKNIFSKLQLRNRAQAVAYAVRAGLVENPPADRF